jgi:hypothetical protein
MADYTRQVKTILSDNGCYFLRHGKGDHDVWFNPAIKKPFTVDGSITKRTSANKTLKSAGLNQKV